MKHILMALYLTCVLGVTARGDETRLDAATLERAREMVTRGLELAERDRLGESIAAIREALAVAPGYVNAHAQYIWVKANYLGQYDEVRAEYEALMVREPLNPVYPMALAIGQGHTYNKQAWYEKVVELAPESGWGHYARAMLQTEKEPEAAAANLKKYIEEDGSWPQAYTVLLYIQEKTLKRPDDAIATAEKMAARTEFRAAGLSSLWRLRLGKAGGSEEAKQNLRDELGRLAASTLDIKLLATIRSAYSGLLEDEESAKAIERKIRGLDGSWYPERGQVIFLFSSNQSGVSRMDPIANRQASILSRMWEVKDDLPPKEKMAGLEKLLSLGPVAAMRRYIYDRIFRVAEKAEDRDAMVKYGEALYDLDQSDTALLAKIAIALADRKKDLRKALQYARRADDITSEFRPLERPANNDAERFKENYTEDRQRKMYKRVRALALEAHGWALCRAGDCADGEAKLREAVALARSESNLSHLAETLSKLGRKGEAGKVAVEARVEFVEAIKRQFTSEPAKDFQLETVDGRRVKLSELKGKVVMLDFWATWCGPCVKASPFLARMYRKYKDRGFEILAISCDDKADRHKVAPFAKEHKLAYPVLFDDEVRSLYKVQAYPTSIFIDRQGNVRYRDVGFGDETPRKIEAVINELVK